MKWFLRLVKFSVLLFLLGVAGLVGFYYHVKHELPTEENIRDVRFQIPMKVFSADGELISQFGEKRRTPLLHKEIPQQLIDAVLATEDSRFYDHYGIDPIGVFRAAFDSIILGKRARGASTITMQLARNAFLTLDRTLIRKIKEIYIAIHIEQLLSKEEILTLYLNKTFFGNRAYGVGAAAQVYYGKELRDLSLPQFAMIAGLPKAPSNYNPLRNPDKAVERRNIVLYRMKAVGAITEADYQSAIASPVTAKRHGANITVSAPYVAEEVRKMMVEKYGEEVAYTEGFNVYTTINAKMQRAAQKAVIDNIHAYDERHGYRGPERYLWQAQKANEDKSAEQEYLESQIDADELELNEQRAADQFVGDSWELEQIMEYLSGVDDYRHLTPAVVTNVTDNSVYVQLKSGNIDVLDWNSLKWARSYISDTEQGSAPKTAHDILAEGALIWLRANNDGSFRLSQIPEVSGAMVALDPQNGDIKALVGGYNFVNNQFNRITQAKRQIGSNIKPFVYSAALDKGYTLATLINDAPINKWDKTLGTAWRPKNSPPTYEGPTRVRRGLAQSKNVMAVKLARSVGINNVVDHLTKFGFANEDLPANESLSLGSASLTPMSVATGMAVFANGGYLVQHQLIDYITNTPGKEVFRQIKTVAGMELEIRDDSDLLNSEQETNSDQSQLISTQFQTPAPRVISPQNAFLIADTLNDTIWGGGNWGKGTGWNGTAWRAQTLKRRDLAGKTGTTNSAVDTWFTGFNASLIATSWVGFDAPGRALGRTSYNVNLPDTQTFGAESGAKTALPAWVNFMAEVLPDIPAQYREIPEGIVSVRIDIETGLLSRKTDHTTRFEYFIQGTEPTEYVDAFATPEEDIIEEEEGLF
ncbi:MAG: penicillin-binding protein 1A [Gammaproteobacteria bacterium]|nr:penicillin-binding protein 1A [Gammaproteobacteria bacterium]